MKFTQGMKVKVVKGSNFTIEEIVKVTKTLVTLKNGKKYLANGTLKGDKSFYAEYITPVLPEDCEKINKEKKIC